MQVLGKRAYPHLPKLVHNDSLPAGTKAMGQVRTWTPTPGHQVSADDGSMSAKLEIDASRSFMTEQLPAFWSHVANLMSCSSMQGQQTATWQTQQD